MLSFAVAGKARQETTARISRGTWHHWAQVLSLFETRWKRRLIESSCPMLQSRKPSREGFHFYYRLQTLLHFPNYFVTLQKPQAPKFFDAKSQFAMFQNASMNFGRALR